MSTKNNSTIVSKASQRITATKKYVPATGTIPVNGQPYTQQQCLAVYQAAADARTNLVTLRGQVAAAVAAQTQADAAMAAFDHGMEGWVNNTFGTKSQAMTDYGYVKKTPVPRTAEQKAAAAAKMLATKAARGEIGKKARSKITAPAAAAPTAASPPAIAAASTTASPPAIAAASPPTTPKS